MRVPSFTQFKYQVEYLSKQFDAISQLRQKSESNKKMMNSSEDPILAQRIKTIQDHLEGLDAYKKNITTAKIRTNLIETNITSAMSELTRVMELVKSAQTDTSSNTDRLNISKELEGLLSNLLKYANSQDVNGDYIYSGSATDREPYVLVNGHYEYQGVQETNSLYIAASKMMRLNENGQAIFGDIKTGNGVFTLRQGPVKNIGTAELSGSVQSGITSINDTYTISFVTNSNGKLAYKVIGSAQGQVIPPLPANIPGDCPEYVEGNNISFNGISLSMKGTPDLSDSFVIEPSKKQNMFETLTQLIGLVKSPVQSQADRAAFHQEITELAKTVAGSVGHLSQFVTEIGFRSKEIDLFESQNNNDISEQSIVLGQYQSADQYELISEITQRMQALELTQQTYVKMEGFFGDLLRYTFK